MSKKHVFTDFSLSEISAVDNPAQEGAKVAIMKRAETTADLILKMAAPEDGAMSFAELLADKERRMKYWEACEEVYPLLDALGDSVRSIIADTQLSLDARRAMIASSVDDFLSTVLGKIPNAESVLREFLTESKGDEPENDEDQDMPDDMKKELDAAVARADAAEKAAAKATKAAEQSQAALDAFKQAEIEKNEEIVKVNGAEIKKSAVGDDAFAALKSQAAEIAKSKRELEIVDATKRAEDAWPNLPGEPVQKGAALLFVEKMDETAKAALETMLNAGNEAMAGRMVAIGKADTGRASTGPMPVNKAEAQLETLAQKIAKDEGVDIMTARVKAQDARPELYNEYVAEKAAG